jgi:HAD superfamily hydrolase (TIGR01549 family)
VKQTLIFDLDGTLYPRENTLYRSMSSMIRQWFQRQLATHDTDMDEYYAWLQRSYPNAFEAIEQLGLSIAAYHAEVFDKLEPDKHLTEDINLREMLHSLSGTKFVVTQSSHGHAVRVLNALGVYSCFSDIYVRNVNWHTCRKLDAYNAIILREGLEPSTTFVIGDNPIVDLHAAFAAGYQCIAISDYAVTGIASVRSVLEIMTLIPESSSSIADDDAGILNQGD